MKAVGIIPARYGSTRFPGKPLALLTRLFERVRYGAGEAGEAEVQQAVESLGAIVAFCQEGKAGA